MENANIRNHESYLLWVDLCQEKNTRLEAITQFSKLFAVKRLASNSLDRGAFKQSRFDAIVFEYDYPDKDNLRLVEKTKILYPSLPIIMLTEQPSAALAIWALRARVWEYMIKPVKSSELVDLTRELRKLRTLRADAPVDRKLMKRTVNAPKEARLTAGSATEVAIRRALSYLCNNLAEKISEKDIAEYCGMSPFRFSREFKKIFSSTYQEYVLSHRIEEAARYLLNPKASIADIACAVGFNDASYFSRAFKKIKGVSPSQYKLNHEIHSGQTLENCVPQRLQLR